MPIKDLFGKPFGEATLTKLDIFEKYFAAWLPVFLKQKGNRPIQVFDFFAGSGYDQLKQPGSPIRIIRIIEKYSDLVSNNNKRICLLLNDKDSMKCEALEKAVDDILCISKIKDFVEVKITNTNFHECIKKYKLTLQKGNNLIFVDQNGFGQVTERIFQYFIRLKFTDFIFFISSDHIRRFVEEPEFMEIHPKFDANKIKSTPHKMIHNVVCSEYRKYIPDEVRDYAIYPFSLMKEDKNNIYGIIFVCKHPLPADKFLHVVWDKNKLNGNANYDIDEDLLVDQGDLFNGHRKTKIEDFQSRLWAKISTGEISDNIGAYYYALNEGHIPYHAAEIIKKMAKNKVISYNSRSPLVNYYQVVNLGRKLEYKVLRNETDKN